MIRLINFIQGLGLGKFRAVSGSFEANFEGFRLWSNFRFQGHQGAGFRF